MTDDDLTQKIIGCAYKVHNTLGCGFLERVYDGTVIGNFYADLWVDEHVVIELKAVQRNTNFNL